jgi:hypothetical protein
MMSCGVFNALTYFVTTVNYWQKMFVKSAPEFNVSKLFSSLLMLEENKLECFTLASLFSLTKPRT